MSLLMGLWAGAGQRCGAAGRKPMETRPHWLQWKKKGGRGNSQSQFSAPSDTNTSHFGKLVLPHRPPRGLLPVGEKNGSEHRGARDSFGPGVKKKGWGLKRDQTKRNGGVRSLTSGCDRRSRLLLW